MEFVKKCKKVWGSSSKRLHPDQDSTGSSSYIKLSEKHDKQIKVKNYKKPPHGCLYVYVGPERQRFVIKIKIANHPLFRTLLEAAEDEFGYRYDGPLWLPCDVDLFCEALAEMESTEHEDYMIDLGSVMGLHCLSLIWSKLNKLRAFGISKLIIHCMCVYKRENRGSVNDH